MIYWKNTPLFLILFLCGCVNILPEPSKEDQKIILNPQVSIAKRTTTSPIVLMVDRPQASETLDTTRIALVHKLENGLQLQDLFAGIEWQESLPRLLQNDFVSILESSGHFKGVSRTNDNLKGSLLLIPEIRHFEVIRTNNTLSSVFLEVDLKLAAVPSRTLIGQKLFKSEKPINAPDLKGVIEAFDRAYEDLLTQSIHWVLSAPS